MMKAEKQTIKKNLEINAPKEKVWDVLLQDDFTRIWYAEFSEGTRAETDWQLGSKVIFRDNSGTGLLGTVLVNRPPEVLSVEYLGLVNGSTEDYDSEEARALKGSRETYRLSDKDGATQVAVEVDMAEEYYEMMSEAWDKALVKIKELAE